MKRFVLLLLTVIACTLQAQTWTWTSAPTISAAVGSPVTMAALASDGYLAPAYGAIADRMQVRLGGVTYSIYCAYDEYAWKTGVAWSRSFWPAVLVNQATGQERIMMMIQVSATDRMFADVLTGSQTQLTWQFRLTSSAFAAVELNKEYKYVWTTITNQTDYSGPAEWAYVTHLSDRGKGGQYGYLDTMGTVSWTKDGVPVSPPTSGAQAANRFIFNIESFNPVRDAGTYEVSYTSMRTGQTIKHRMTVVDAATQRGIPAAISTGKLINISARSQVEVGQGVLVGGIVIAGGKAKVLVRAVGPGLTAFHVPGVLADPKLTAYFNQTPIGENVGWSSSANAVEISAATTAVSAFPLAGASKDCAMLLTLDPGNYTFQVSGVNDTTGVALLEIYLVPSSNTGYLANLSARTMAGSGSKTLTVGFYTEGATQVLVRGVGPTLGQFGIGSPLASAAIDFFNGGIKADSAGSWATTYNKTEAAALFNRLQAFSLPDGSADSMFITTLNDSLAHTAEIKSTATTDGIALAEIYLVKQ